MKPAVIGLLLALAAPAVAQDVPGGHEANAPSRDAPIGAPYHTGEVAQSDQVTVRDYLSSRIDQLRADIIDRLEQQSKQQRDIIDERDKQYAQRFEAQQKALGDRFEAQQKALADALVAVESKGTVALAAAKEAVTKAEDASNKRFEGVNEFRKQLGDQALTFMSKDEGNARFKSLEDKVLNVERRLDDARSEGAGANNLWGYIIGVIGLLLALGMFVMNARKSA